MYTWKIGSQILNLGQNILHMQIKCLVSNLTKDVLVQGTPCGPKDLFYCQILNQTF
jgi:hypothetical protein